MRKLISFIVPAFFLPLSEISAQNSFSILEQNKISSTQGSFPDSLNSNDQFGMASVSIGDLNKDGIEDIAVSAPFDDDGGTDRGAVYILFMDIDDKVKDYKKISSTTQGFTGKLSNGSYWGFGMDYLGDLNNDGNIELAVGATNFQNGGADDGAVYILSLDSAANVKSYQEISYGQGGFTADIDDESFGYSLSNIGDINNDGITDMIVGARNTSIGGTHNGAVYILFLDTNSTVKSYEKINEGTQNFSSNLPDYGQFGTSVTGIGDINGDGYIDIAVGAFKDNDGGTDHGAVYIIFLSPSGNVIGFQKISSVSGNFNNVLQNGDRFGRSVRGIPDLNNDGREELVVGAGLDNNGGLNRGAFYVLYLDTTGTVDSYEKINHSRNDFNINLNDDDGYAQSIGLILSSSANNKLIVGTPRDDDGGTNFGAVFVLEYESSFNSGLVEPKEAYIKLYPNPAETFTKINSTEKMQRITITNISGQHVFQETNLNTTEYELELENLKSGIYFISVQGKNFKEIKKIVKE